MPEMIEVLLDWDEPVYRLSLPNNTPSESIVEIPRELWERYQRVVQEYNELQTELGALK